MRESGVIVPEPPLPAAQGRGMHTDFNLDANLFDIIRLINILAPIALP